MYFATHAFSNHAVVLHNVTPIDLPAQSAVLSDGVVASVLHKAMCQTIPLLWRGVKPVHFAMHAFSNHAVVLHNVTPIDLPAQSAVLSDGVVASVLHKAMCQTIPLLWRGVKPVHFAMHAFSNHAVVLHNVTPIDLPAQSAVLSDGVVFCVPTKLTKSAPTHVGSLHHPNRPNALHLH